jgi:NifU-like protein
MPLYPDNIAASAFAPRFARRIDSSGAHGADASFVCGSYIGFDLLIEPGTDIVTDIGYRTNGCGFMIAAAEHAASAVVGRSLPELHALEDIRIEVPPARADCRDIAVRALRNAFAEFRKKRLTEFQGEKALVCTCFGVTEETIARSGALTVEEAGRRTNAGTGCGSCRMLVEEIVGTASADF